MKRLYAIRGAVCAENSKESIAEKTVKMCDLIFKENNIRSEDIVSMHFTLTKDLDEANPCAALRRGCKSLDVSAVPLFCSQEAYVKGALEKVIRLMITVYLEEGTELRNIYIDGAEKLRPDFASKK